MIEIYTEDIFPCHRDNYGGIAHSISYAPVSYFEKIELPIQGNLSESKQIASDKIRLKTGKKIKCIEVFVEQNSLQEKTAGSIRNWKSTSELHFSLLGLVEQNLGFAKQIKNEALVFLVPDSNGKIWVFGNVRNPAYCSSVEGNTGKKIEEDSLVHFSFVANTELYLYKGTIENLNP